MNDAAALIALSFPSPVSNSDTNTSGAELTAAPFSKFSVFTLNDAHGLLCAIFAPFIPAAIQNASDAERTQSRVSLLSVPSVSDIFFAIASCHPAILSVTHPACIHADDAHRIAAAHGTS